MIINSLTVKNFKTLNFDNLRLNNYYIIIGPNGAGKSNLVLFFKFISILLENDLDTALA
ncbi:MAG: hypothetical protein OEY49_15840 [Candidatus Heimdallarchaeota archaeon]|nr:hypothetical protein [Candidatus Heimdallarchaeota archaeon]